MPLLIVIIVAVTGGLAWLVGSGATEAIGISSQQAGQALPLIVILGLIASAVVTRRRRLGEVMGNLAIWVAVFGVLLVGYAYRDDLQAIGARVYGELVPGQAIVDANGGTATFRRGRDGHFQVNASVNGANLPLIFDTGATAVVLTAQDARRAGIDTNALTYNVLVSTANGTGRAAAIRLQRIEVGGIVRTGIRAFIAEDGALETSLLGMSFLETLQSYSVQQNALELVG